MKPGLKTPPQTQVAAAEIHTCQHFFYPSHSDRCSAENIKIRKRVNNKFSTYKHTSGFKTQFC